MHPHLGDPTGNGICACGVAIILAPDAMGFRWKHHIPGQPLYRECAHGHARPVVQL